jgi:hypothetical protein
MVRKYTLTVTKEEIELILKVLAEQPFNVVSEIIVNLAKQLQDQKVEGIDGDH